MSEDALEIYNLHRQEQLDNSPFSDVFSYGVGKKLYGYFDFSPEQDTEDAGHVAQKQRKPRIIVGVIPDDLSEKDDITQDSTGTVFTVHYFGEDDNGVPHIWLYLKRT